MTFNGDEIPNFEHLNKCMSNLWLKFESKKEKLMKIKRIIKNKLTLIIIACGVFLLSSSFTNSFFEIAKQIEILPLYKELRINYVDETNPADLMTTGIKAC